MQTASKALCVQLTADAKPCKNAVIHRRQEELLVADNELASKRIELI